MSTIEKNQDFLRVYAHPEMAAILDFERQEPQQIKALDPIHNTEWLDRITASIGSWIDRWSWFVPAADNQIQVNLEASYQQGLDRAHEGRFEEARSLWMADLEKCETSEQWVYVMENLCWLDLFSENMTNLEANASLLLQGEENNPTALYGLAYVSFFDKDYERAQSYLQIIQDSQAPCSDILAYQVNDLERRIGVKTGERDVPILSYLDLNAETVDLMTTDEQRRFVSYTSHQNWTQREKIGNLFGSQSIDSYKKFQDQVESLLNSGKISREELPWISHLYFRNTMHYSTDLTPDGLAGARTLDESFADKKYDCTEYADGIAKVLRYNHIPVFKLRFRQGWQSDGQPLYHVFVAYRMNGQWGYLSPTRVSEPRFASPEDVATAWDWDSIDGVFASI